MPLRVSISGIRGVIGDGLDAVGVARWASAFGAWLPPGPVVVWRVRSTLAESPMGICSRRTDLCLKAEWPGGPWRR